MKKVATKAEKEHMSKVAQMGCYACEINGIENYAAVHHIRNNGSGNVGIGRRSSHYETIPLCYEHHQGNHSIHNRKIEFEKKYGTEKEILKIILSRL